MSGMSGMLGMGVTIHLRDLFTGAATRVGRASTALSNTLIDDTKKLNAARRQLMTGVGMMAGGGLLGAILTGISVKAIKAGSDLEQFENQYIVLLKGRREEAKALFNDVTRFAAETPFNIPEVVAAGKNLLAFGIAAKDVKEQLKYAGDWSSIFNRSLEWTSTVIGRLATGSYGRIYPALRSMGIQVKELGKYGAPMTKDGLIQRTADPKVVLDALNKYIGDHFWGGMAAKMSTIPGRISNIEDKIILTFGNMGKAMKSTVFGIVKGIEEALDPDHLKAFSTAVGQGLSLIVKGLAAILKPLGVAFMGLVKLSEAHPGIVKVGTALLGAAAATLIFVGALVALHAVQKMIVLSGAGGTLAKWGASFMAMLPVLGWIAVAIFAIAAAARVGDNSVMTVLKGWWEGFKAVASGLFELFTSISNGVGYMSLKTAENLKSRGLLEPVITIFMIGYRFYQVLAGAFAGLSQVLGSVATVLGWVLQAINWLLEPVFTLAGYMGILQRNVPVDVFKALGYAIGLVVGWMIVYRAVMMTMTAWNWIAGGVIMKLVTTLVSAATAFRGLSFATIAAKLATWGFNAALWANPIVWIIAIVLGLVVALVLLVKNWKAVNGAMQGVPDWVILLTPTMMILGFIIKYWDKLKQTVLLSVNMIKITIKSLADGVVDHFKRIISVILATIKALLKLIPSQLLPEGLRSMKIAVQHMTADSVFAVAGKAYQDFRAATPDDGVGKGLDSLNAQMARMNQLMELNYAKDQQERGNKIYLDGRQIFEVIKKRTQEEHESGR